MCRLVSILSVLLSLAFGCGSDVPGADGSLVLAQTDLGYGALVGVTVDAEGRRFVLSEAGDLFERVGDSWELRWSEPSGLPAVTDIVALGEGRFALTTRNMGYELDLATGGLTQHFCYLPGDEIREEPPPQTTRPTAELSRSVAYDASANLLYAQPQTITDDGGAMEMLFSEVAVFDRVSGDELFFRNLDDAAFSAGGLVAMGDGELLYGERTRLLRGNFESGDHQAVLDLRAVGIERIEGLALDRTADALLVVDGEGQLTELRFSALGL